MAYSFPPRGFSVIQNDLSAPENCEVSVNSTPEKSQCSSRNGKTNQQMNDNRYFGHLPPRCDSPWMNRPPHPHPFPNNFGGHGMPRPRPRNFCPSFPRQTFHHRPNFDNNWPRHFGHNGPPQLGYGEQQNENGYPRFQNQRQPWQHPQNSINKGPSAKKRKKNSRTQLNWSDTEAVKDKTFDFFCDMCDRGFKSDETYQEHLRSHVKCDVTGCKFEGAFKIVKQHKKMQHTPHSRPIGPLETPEELEKWRQERRKRYPTISNVERKETELKERIKSGNVLKTKNFGKMKHKPETYESDQQKSKHQGEKSQTEESSLGSLGSLMAAYGGSGSEEGDKESSEEDGEIRTDTKPAPQTDNVPGMKKLNWKEKRKLRRKEMKLNKRNNRKIEQPSKRRNLLEMLLAADIRHERNVLLQCVRFIVRKQFFDSSTETVNGGENLQTSNGNQGDSVTNGNKEVKNNDNDTEK